MRTYSPKGEFRRTRAFGAATLSVCVAVMLGGCGSGGPSTTTAKQRRAGGEIPAKLLAAERPIGRGPRFHPPVQGPVTGRCTPTLGARSHAHLEVFGADRVVLLATGIGTRPPRQTLTGRIVQARCFGSLVTLDPTGTVYFRPHAHLTVGDVFRAWGQPLSAHRIASFTGGAVTVYINGRLHDGPPEAVPLTNGAEIVLEIGPHVPPHDSFTFAPTPSPQMR